MLWHSTAVKAGQVTGTCARAPYGRQSLSNARQYGRPKTPSTSQVAGNCAWHSMADKFWQLHSAVWPTNDFRTAAPFRNCPIILESMIITLCEQPLKALLCFWHLPARVVRPSLGFCWHRPISVSPTYWSIKQRLLDQSVPAWCCQTADGRRSGSRCEHCLIFTDWT